MSIDRTKLPEDVSLDIDRCVLDGELPSDLKVAFEDWYFGCTERHGPPSADEILRALDSIRTASGEDPDGELGRLPVGWFVEHGKDQWWVGDQRDMAVKIRGRGKTANEALRAALGEGAESE